jgi:hypothetical protein
MNEIDIEQALGEIIYYTRFFRSFGSMVPTFHAELLTYFHSFPC